MPTPRRARNEAGKLGLACVNLGQLDKARKHLERFLKLAPQDPEAAAVKETLKALK